MLSTAEARRQEVARELAQVNREIAVTQKRMAEIQARIAVLTKAQVKAA